MIRMFSYAAVTASGEEERKKNEHPQAVHNMAPRTTSALYKNSLGTQFLESTINNVRLFQLAVKCSISIKVCFFLVSSKDFSNNLF
jgi:hypothetical protein